jgi:hypothetical protein
MPDILAAVPHILFIIAIGVALGMGAKRSMGVILRRTTHEDGLL